MEKFFISAVPIAIFFGFVFWIMMWSVLKSTTWYFDKNGDQVTVDGKKIPYRTTTTLVEYGTPNRNMDIFKWDKDES